MFNLLDVRALHSELCLKEVHSAYHMLLCWCLPAHCTDDTMPFKLAQMSSERNIAAS